MTKRELKKQQKNEALVEKISQMTDAEYAKKQNRLLKSIFALNGVSLVFLAVILSSVILLGFNLHAFSLFASVIIGSMAGVAATEIIKHKISKVRSTNNFVRSHLISMEEVEAEQERQSREIIERIKAEQAKQATKDKTITMAEIEEDCGVNREM